MNLIKIKDFNISSVGIKNPLKRTNGYGSEIAYNGLSFVIQSPVVELSHVEVKGDNEEKKKYLAGTFQLSDNFEYFQIFCSIHELIIRYLVRYSTYPDYDILKNTDGSEDEIREKFTSSINKSSNSNMFIKVKLTNETMFFDKKKYKISGLELNKGDKVIFIIRPNPIVSDNESAAQSWTCIQCLKLN